MNRKITEKLDKSSCEIQKFNKVIMTRVIPKVEKVNIVPRSSYTRTVKLERQAMATLMAHYQRGPHYRGRTLGKG